MTKIKRFIEVFVPKTACNLRCHYCYLSQTGISTNYKAKFRYSDNVMKKSISKSRLGGTCLFNIVADGETMLDASTMKFIHNVLEEGHFINIVTNATLTNRIQELCELPLEYRQRIMYIVSFHYLELKRLDILDKFFENINLIKGSGSSFYLSLVLCKEYIECIDEIKKVTYDNLGILPQPVKVRDDTTSDLRLLVDLDENEYYNYGIKEFSSPLFQFEKEWYNKRIDSFCYAGDWMVYLNLCTGELRACYNQPVFDNLFENPSKKVKFHAIGNHCKVPYCYNGVSRIPLGVIPEYKDLMYYWQYRDRVNEKGEHSINEYYRNALSIRLYDTNREYSSIKKHYINKKYEADYEKKKNIMYYIQKTTPKRVISKLMREIKRENT